MEGRFIKNRYRLDRRLGEGGMGVVYQAFDRLENCTVAVKLAGLSSYHEASARFQREAQAMARLSHPNIVQVYETGEDAGVSFIVMEYLSGKQLRELIPLPVPEALAIAIQTAKALECAHSQEIIHRDIKPENLMVLSRSDGESECVVKVMDFGLARRLQDQLELTETGMLIGTAAYISPEQALGYKIDARSDLYALGVVLFEMLTGHCPFPGDNMVAVIYQHLNEPPPSPRKFNPNVPVPLEQVILRLLRKDPAERFSSASELIAVLEDIQMKLGLLSSGADAEATTEDSVTVIGGLPLVGRESEFAALRACVMRARGGQGQLALISGEPGVGTTRLAQELLTYARLYRFQVLSAVCYEQEGSFPYQPFIDAFRSYISRLSWQDIEALQHALQGYGGELVALVPEAARICGEATRPLSVMSPEQAKARLFEAIRQFVVAICQLSPVVFFLDDLQWADATSLQLLQYIIRRAPEQSLLILATYHISEANQQLADFASSVGRERTQRLISLERLTPEQTTTVIGTLLGADHISTRLQEQIYAIAEGNPFFTVETVHHLVEEGLLTARDGEWRIISTVQPGISANVQEVIERRLAHLPSRTREILAMAAVIGRRFSFSLLKELTNTADDELIQVVDRCLMSGLIQERQQRKEEHYDFSNTLIREVIYAGLTATRRRMLHQRVGEIVEKRNAQHRDEVLGDLAYHFSRGTDVSKAIEYSYLAGKQAASVYATENAFSYLDTARELVEEEGRKDHLVDILESLGTVSIIVGRFDTAVASFQQAIQILEGQRSQPIGRLLRLKGEISGAYERLGRYDTALQELESGLTIAGKKETVDGAYLRGQLAVIHSRFGDLQKAMEYAVQDLRMAEKLGDEEEVGQACNILYKLHSLRSNWEQARHFTERALEIWKKRNDVYRQEWTYLNLGATLYTLGHWQEAESNWQKALEISRNIRYTQGIVQNSLNLGYLSMRRGEYSQAEILCREALSLSREMGHTYYLARSTMRLAELSQQQGALDKAIELFSEAEDILRGLGHKTGLAELLWLLADAYVELGQFERAQELAEESIALAPKPDGYEEVGNASRVLAKVYMKKGDRGQTHQLLQHSIHCLEKLGDSYGQALARTELAGFLSSSRSATDQAEALSLLDKAVTDFVRLRATPDVRKAEALMSQLQGQGNRHGRM